MSINKISGVNVKELKKKIFNGKTKEVILYLQSLEPKTAEEIHNHIIKFFEYKYYSTTKGQTSNSIETMDSKNNSQNIISRDTDKKMEKQKRIIRSEESNASVNILEGKYVRNFNLLLFKLIQFKAIRRSSWKRSICKSF
jgi:hypothetical protein